MTTQIILNQREIDKLNAAAEILKEYGRIYSESVKNKSGFFMNSAGTAAGLIEQIIKDSAPQPQEPPQN